MADILARTRSIIGTNAEWTANNLILGAGEIAIIRTGATVDLRIGDGVTPCLSCPSVVGSVSFPFASAAEVAAGVAPNKAIAPATIDFAGIAASAGAGSGDRLIKTNTGGLMDNSFLPTVQASAGAPDAGKYPRLNAAGKIDLTMMPANNALIYKGTINPTLPAPAGPAAGWFYIANTAGAAHASWLGIAGLAVAVGDQLLYDGSAWGIIPINATLAGYLQLTGGTMTGPLILAGAPTATLEAATKGYVDANTVNNLTGTANQIIVSGATGAVTLSTPQDIHAGANPTFAALTLSSAYLNFSGTGQRITGDFSNPAIPSRLLFQSNVVDALTALGIIPNGTNQQAGLAVFNNSDPANAALMYLNAFDGGVGINADKTGAGLYPYFQIQVGGYERFRLPANVNRFQVNTIDPSPANRFAFQDSVPNNPTSLNVWPNGTSQAALVQLLNKSTAVDASAFTFYIDAMQSIIASERTGAGTYLPFVINVGGAERMRISTTGDIGIGTTPTGVPANGTSINPAVNGSHIVIGHNIGTPNGVGYLGFCYGAGYIGAIQQNTTSSVSYNTTSDYRLKNIEGEIQDSGDFIDALRPVYGTWKLGGEYFAGLIAHEVATIARATVSGEKDALDKEGKPAYQSMDYSSGEIIGNIIAELKSLRARVARVETIH